MSVALDQRMLDLAARLALRGAGDVEPNPMVGAVLVRDERVIGMGHHRRYGGPHAEREAVEDCRRRGECPRGATLYVTLEPCRKQGKQPPCTELIVREGIARVVCARADPHPKGSGGSEDLRRAGVVFEFTDASPLAQRVSDPFVRRVSTGLPWVIAKWAQTIDGRTATRTGESRWISNDLSRRRVHRLRARMDAIITGLGTVLADDPMLTARDVARVRRVARRVVIDTELDIPLDCTLVRTARDYPLIVACDRSLLQAPITREKVERLRDAGATLMGAPCVEHRARLDLVAVLRALVEDHGVTSALLEAGPGLLGSFFREDLVDEAVVYIAPIIMGDEQAQAVASGSVIENLRQSMRFDLWHARTLRSDVELTYRRCRAMDTALQ